MMEAGRGPTQGLGAELAQTPRFYTAECFADGRRSLYADVGRAALRGPPPSCTPCCTSSAPGSRSAARTCGPQRRSSRWAAPHSSSTRSRRADLPHSVGCPADETHSDPAVQEQQDEERAQDLQQTPGQAVDPATRGSVSQVQRGADLRQITRRRGKLLQLDRELAQSLRRVTDLASGRFEVADVEGLAWRSSGLLLVAVQDRGPRGAGRLETARRLAQRPGCCLHLAEHALELTEGLGRLAEKSL